MIDMMSLMRGRRAGGACAAQGGWDGGAQGPARARSDVAHDEVRGASQAGDASLKDVRRRSLAGRDCIRQ